MPIINGINYTNKVIVDNEAYVSDPQRGGSPLLDEKNTPILWYEDNPSQPKKKWKYHKVDAEKGIDVWEEVIQEAWCWEALYNDGTSLKQFDDEGIFHRSAEIQQAKLLVFRMVSPVTGRMHSIMFDPEHMELVHFYNNKVLGFNTDSPVRLKLYVFGYKTKVKRSGEYGGDVTISVLNVIMPGDQEVIVTDDLNKIVIE